MLSKMKDASDQWTQLISDVKQNEKRGRTMDSVNFQKIARNLSYVFHIRPLPVRVRREEIARTHIHVS